MDFRIVISWRNLALIGLLCCSCCCIITAVQDHLIKPDVFLNIDRDLVPFDHKTLLAHLNLKKPEAQDYPPLGLVETVGTILSAPHFFPASFNIYTRDGNITNIQLKSLLHCMNAKQADGGPKIDCKSFQFNLTQLAPPLNPFDPERRTIIVVPGYLSNIEGWMHEIRDNWLKFEDVNVILVDWSQGNSDTYDTAVSNVKILSRQITMLIYYLAQLHQADFESTHFRNKIQFVGHSLGAHVSGFVGQELRGEVGRITGLDPAGPIFDTLPPNYRLSTASAQLVDVIHTNAGEMEHLRFGIGLLREGAKTIVSKLYKSTAPKLADSLDNYRSASGENTAWFGMKKSIGHLDYYANGGSIQPGCNDDLHICDHGRACDIYIHSIEYELYARRAYSQESNVIRSGRHRLEAFPSPDYERFKTGVSLLRNCPSLVTSNKLNSEPPVTDDERYETYRKCSIPIDFLSKPSDFRTELAQQYNIPLDKSGNSEEEEEERLRFYFDTAASKPFVGEHYMLRLHTTACSTCEKYESTWSKGCTLNILLMNNTSSQHTNEDERQVSIVKYSPTSLEPTEKDDFNGLIIPFVNPVDWRQINFPTPANIDKQLSDYDQLKLNVPGGLKMELIFISQAGATKQVIWSLSSLLKNSLKLAGEAKEMCELTFSAVEIRPLISMIHNISAWYLDDLDIKGSLVSVPKSRLSHAELLKFMAELEKPVVLNSSKQNVSMSLAAIGFDQQPID